MENTFRIVGLCVDASKGEQCSPVVAMLVVAEILKNRILVLPIWGNL